jgi:hypothetical protein
VTLTLSCLPRGTNYQLRPVRSVEVQRAATGGSRLSISHPGDHWAIEVETGVMALMDARALSVDVLLATANPVRLRVPQPDLDIGTPGKAIVSGDGQAGSFLALTGLTPGYWLRKGQFLTVETSDSGRLYQVAAHATADAFGAVTVALWPILHVPPMDGDPVEIAEPYIEGLIEDGGGHEVGLIAAGEPEGFTIEEEN